VPIAYPRWPPQGNNSLLLDPMRISFKDLFLRNFYKPLGLEIKRFRLSKFQNISQVIDIENLLGHGHFDDNWKILDADDDTDDDDGCKMMTKDHMALWAR
jgi:hypothetical protein